MTILRVRRSRNKLLTTIFPLAADASGHFLNGINGSAYPILGRAVWAIIGLTQSAYQTVIDDTVDKGFNAIEIQIPNKDLLQANIPFANNGTLLPFVNSLNGSAWSGSLSYANDGEKPNFTSINESYWAFVDTFLDYCASKNLLVIMGNCYNGDSIAGWRGEMVANGPTKMQTYGEFIGNRFAARKNILWILAGDYGAPPHAYSPEEVDVMDAYTTGLSGITKQSNLYTADPASDNISTNITAPVTAAAVNVVGGYSFNNTITQQCRSAWGTSKPSILLECPYDEEGTDGTNINPAASQPVRRFMWWGWLSAIGGWIHGNGYIWTFQPGYNSHLSTAGTLDMARLIDFIKSITWQALVPDGLSGIGTLITSGKGTIDTSNYWTAAATADGSLLVAYGGPSSGNPTVDMTKLRATATARWFDPTNGSYTAIGSIANTGTHAFTKLGNNSAGDGDWVLRLDA